MRFAIYSRKSVYTGKGESIENQIEMCKQYIFTKYDGVTETDLVVYEDEGFSGKNTDRPHFQQMLKEIKQKQFNYVVCYRLDRISRNVSDFSTLIEELNNREISFICIKEEFDTSKPMGKAMMYIASVFAQLERETIAERVRDNMLMLARTGCWLGGTTPMGFTSEKVLEVIVDGKAKISYKLKSNSGEIHIVKLMFDQFLELQSLTGVGKYLMRQNIKTRAGKYYSRLGIKEILLNPVYCIADKDARDYFVSHDSEVCFEEKDCSDKWGLISYNKRDYKKGHAPRQLIEHWIIAIGKHKGIVSGKQWIAVQNLIEVRKTDRPSSNTHNHYALLSGMIICKKCQSRMFSKPRSGNHTVYDYLCENKMRAGKGLCDCQNLNGQKADDTVCGYLMQYINENSNLVQLLEKLSKELQREEKQNPLNEVNLRIEKCNQEMENLMQALSQGKVGSAFVKHVNDKITELDEVMEQFNAEKIQIQSSLSTVCDTELQIDVIAGVLSNLKDNFKSLTVPEKRTFIKLLIQKIEWDGENLHIFIYGE